MTRRILVVDDDSSVRKVLSAQLTEEGYEVETAESGERALERVKHAGFDLILLDLKMPGWDGARTAREFVEHKPSIPVLILSGYVDEDATAELESMPNVKGWISKPYESDKLARQIERILDAD